MLWQYTAATPYSPADKAKILGCLDQIEASLSQPEENAKPWASEDKVMIDSLKRNYARNFTEDDFTKSDQAIRWWNDRDRSMYLNFQWLDSHLPLHSKVIVWAATVHVAKTLGGIDGFEGKIPFGSYIRREFGDRSFSLGFSAYSGDYAFVHHPVQQLSVAPDSSLEGEVFARTDFGSVYLSRKNLRKYGPIAARPLGIDFETGLWNSVLDGLVVFRKERAPGYLGRRDED
jgi:erythromycin esterase-like protein